MMSLGDLHASYRTVFACEPALRWLGQQKDLAAAWQSCPEPGWLLYHLASQINLDGSEAAQKLVTIYRTMVESLDLQPFDEPWGSTLQVLMERAIPSSWPMPPLSKEICEGRASLKERGIAELASQGSHDVWAITRGMDLLYEAVYQPESRWRARGAASMPLYLWRRGMPELSALIRTPFPEPP
jgi:hypothetical protein